MSKIDFIIKCVNLRPDIKFQYWINDNCTKHYYFSDLQLYHFYKHKNFLRYSIETETLTEIRLDLDENSLDDNINLGIELYNKLKSHNIKASFYTTGGKGVHLQFLLNLGDHKIKMDHRKKFKQFFLSQLNILDYVDHAPLSPFTLLGCEGYSHRKTGKLKIYIDIEKFNTLKSITNYINNNYDKVILNDKFFTDIAKIPSCVNVCDFLSPIKEVLVTPTIQKQKKPLKTPHIKTIGKEHQFMLKVFAILHINYKISSKYRFSILFIKYFYDLGLTREAIENLFNNLKALLNINDLDFGPAYSSAQNFNANFYKYFKSLESENIGFNYHNYQTIIRTLKAEVLDNE